MVSDSALEWDRSNILTRTPVSLGLADSLRDELEEDLEEKFMWDLAPILGLALPTEYILSVLTE